MTNKITEPGPETIAVFNALCDYYDLWGFMPTLRELAKEMKSVHSVIAYHVNQLERFGWIEKHKGSSPRIKVLKHDS